MMSCSLYGTILMIEKREMEKGKKESSLEAFGDENHLGTTGRKTVMRQC